MIDRSVALMDIRTHVVETKLATPITTAIHNANRMWHLLVRVTDGRGCDGIGHSFAFSRPLVMAMEAVALDLARAIQGRAFSSPEKAWDALMQAATFIGRTGLATMAIAAIDTALWDAAARRSDLPL